ncbi:MAG: aldo/keto reductase, partial [Pseudomonadota bacterium]
TSRAHIEGSVDASLRLMGVDVIDVLLIHRPDPFMDHHETGAALDDLVTSGKVKAIGVSNFRPWNWSLLQSAMENKLVTNQIELSVLAHEPFVNGDLADLQAKGVPPMAWSPLAGGTLFQNQPVMDALRHVADDQDCDPTAVAVAWLLAHPANIIPVMGTNTLSRISTLSDATRVAMDRETWYEIYTAALGREVA